MVRDNKTAILSSKVRRPGVSSTPTTALPDTRRVPFLGSLQVLATTTSESAVAVVGCWCCSLSLLVIRRRSPFSGVAVNFPTSFGIEVRDRFDIPL